MNKRKPGSNLDEAVAESFPASDPPAVGSPTSTEAPRRPVDRKPPVITRDEVEAAERDEGHRHLHKRSRARREKHHGLGEDEMHEGDKSDASVVEDHAGVGRSGKRGSR
jgi:hypothetical protein